MREKPVSTPPTFRHNLIEMWQASLSARTRFRVQLALLCLLSVLPFLPSVDGPFLFDDLSLVGRYPNIEDPEVLRRIWTSDLFDIEGDRKGVSYYRPLVTMSYALNWRAGGGDPLGFHVSNLVLHAIATGLAFSFLRRLLGQETLAFWATLLFAIHPTKAESVAWISGRTDILCTIFLLLSGSFFYLEQKARSRRPRVAFALAKWTAAVFAFLSKESALVLPAIFLVEAWVVMGRPDFPELRHKSRMLVRWVLPAVLLGCVYLGLRLWLMPLSQASAPGGLVDQVRVVFAALGENARLIFFPSDLTFYSNRFALDGGRYHLPSRYIAMGVLFAGGLAAIFIRGLRGVPTLAVLVGCFFVFVAPTSQFATTGLRYLTQARYLYLPLLALAPLAFWGARRRAPLLHGLGSCLFLVCAVRTTERSADFGSTERFWGAELRHNPTVPEVLGSQLEVDFRVRGRRFAIRRALCAAGFADRQTGGQSAGPLVLFALTEATNLLEDGHPMLTRAADFVRATRKGEAAEFDGPVHLVMAKRAAADVKRNPIAALETEAWLRVRAGDPERGFHLADEVKRLCRFCSEQLRSLAKMAVLFQNEPALRSLSRDLDAAERQKLYDALRRRKEAEKARGAIRTWELLQLGLSLDEPAFAFRLVAGESSLLHGAGPENVLIGVAQAAMSSGERETALRLFYQLSEEPRNELLRQGWTLGPSADAEHFVPGTCALPSEL